MSMDNQSNYDVAYLKASVYAFVTKKIKIKLLKDILKAKTTVSLW